MMANEEQGSSEVGVRDDASLANIADVREKIQRVLDILGERSFHGYFDEQQADHPDPTYFPFRPPNIRQSLYFNARGYNGQYRVDVQWSDEYGFTVEIRSPGDVQIIKTITIGW